MFKAEDAVPKLEFDFTQYVEGCKGVSPEPSNISLLTFNMNMRALVDAERRIKTSQVQLEIQKADKRSKDEKQAELEKWAAVDLDAGAMMALDEIIAIIPVEEGEELQRRQAQLVADVLKQVPTTDQIMSLPGRVRQAYFGWIAGQLMDPEFGAAGTKA